MSDHQLSPGGSIALEEPPRFQSMRELEAYILSEAQTRALSSDTIDISSLLRPEQISRAIERSAIQWIMDSTKRILDDAYQRGELVSSSPLLQSVISKRSQVDAIAKNQVFSVCVRPAEIQDIEKFISSVHKHVKSKLYIKARYCFETATDDTSLSGIHTHMLLWTAKPEPPSLIKQRVKQSFSQFGTVNINVQSLTNQSKIENTEQYIGKLPGPDSSKHQDDILFRQKYNLENYYLIGIVET
jgi:hypothetical protein